MIILAAIGAVLVLIFFTTLVVEVILDSVEYLAGAIRKREYLTFLSTVSGLALCTFILAMFWVAALRLAFFE